MWQRAPVAACALLSLVVSTNTWADDSSFIFEAASPQPYAPAYLGNGVLGLDTTPLATSAAGMYLAGVYDHTKDDVPRIARAPAWNEIDVFNGSHWLNATTSFGGIGDYRQMLDMYNGVLRTSYVWTDGDKRMRIEAEEFVSRDDAALAATRVTIKPEFSGSITVRLPLRNWPAPHRYAYERMRTPPPEAEKDHWVIWYPGHLDVSDANVESSGDGALMSLVAIAPGTGVKTGEAVATQWTAAGAVETHKDRDGAEAEWKGAVKKGQSYTFTKFAAIQRTESSAAEKAAITARQTGFDALLSASSAAWHKLWESDIVVEGDPKLQRTIHSMLFYLLGSTREGLGISTGPMGLSNAGYHGHIFWDADTFMFPALLVLHPEIARPMVAFRSRTREAARENAKHNGYQGAMYPWEAGPDGAETTPRFAFQNASSENHVNGDVALAAWQYWAATGDRAWLENDCWPILRDTADFWASRVSYVAARGRYEIANVVAVNESDIGVSNDAYTNAIAKKNFDLAMAIAQELHVEPHPKWAEVSEKMYVPDSHSSLLWFPLDRPHTPQQTRSAIDTALAEAQRHQLGAMMGIEFYPIMAVEIGERLALGKLLDQLSYPFLRPPFQAIAETPENQNINFITGAGAFLQQFVFGYTGLRLTRNGLERRFPSMLPPGVTLLTLKNITVRGKRETLTFHSSAQ